MLSLFALAPILLLASSAWAAPALYNATPAHTSLAKRDAVCQFDFRRLVDFDSCLPTKIAFTLTPPSKIVEKKFTTEKTVPADVQCDHIVELNFLDSIAESSGLCTVLGALVKAKPALTKAGLLANAAAHISDASNLNFLDSAVNNRKKTVIQRAHNNKLQDHAVTAIDKAVGNYLTHKEVEAVSKQVAAKLDDDLADILAQAERVLKDLPDGKGGRDKQTALKKDLKDAIDAFKTSKDAGKASVAAAWNTVLSRVPKGD